ncbi:MAG: O-antigen ligase family protein [Verrucomicrobiota bacterium]
MEPPTTTDPSSEHLFRTGLLLFATGFFFIWWDYLHASILVGGLVFALLRTRRWSRCELLFSELSLTLATTLVAATLFRSLIVPIPLHPKDALGLILAPIGFLALFLGARDRPGDLRPILIGVVVIACLTGLISFIQFIHSPFKPHPHARLWNLFVNRDGLHPVLTGLTSAFAAVAASGLFLTTRRSLPRLSYTIAMIILIVVCFYTQSRGALLSLGSGLLALLLISKSKTALIPLLIFLAVGAFYQLSPRFIEYSKTKRPVESSPVERLVDRKDSGRLALYRLIWSRMETRADFFFGRGISANASGKRSEIGWPAHHPHCAYLGTFYHGGATALLLLAGILGLTASRLCQSSLLNEPNGLIWTALLAAGAAGLIADGANFQSLLSIPRIEPLLFWLPLLTLNGLWAGSHRADTEKQPVDQKEQESTGCSLR